MRLGGILQNTGLLLLSTAVSLGLAEIAVRIFVPVRDVGPSFSVHDPFFGKRIKAGFSAERRTPEFRMRLTTNSLGFRGPLVRPLPAGMAARVIGTAMANEARTAIEKKCRSFVPERLK